MSDITFMITKYKKFHFPLPRRFNNAILGPIAKILLNVFENKEKYMLPQGTILDVDKTITTNIRAIKKDDVFIEFFHDSVFIELHEDGYKLNYDLENYNNIQYKYVQYVKSTDGMKRVWYIRPEKNWMEFVLGDSQSEAYLSGLKIKKTHSSCTIMSKFYEKIVDVFGKLTEKIEVTRNDNKGELVIVI